MSFRFRHSVKLFPGVRLNLSTSGMSVSVGGPGATINFSSRGTAVTVGLPGTGLSYRQQISSKTPASDVRANLPALAPPAIPKTDFHAPNAALPVEIRSADVASLTSPDLHGLKDLINAAAAQKVALAQDLKIALRDRLKAWRKLQRRQRFPFRLIMKRSIPRVRGDFEAAEAEAQKVADAIALSRVHINYGLSDAAMACLQVLDAAHAALARSARCWDVTSVTEIDRYRSRSAASRAITRTPIQLYTVSDGVVAGDQQGLRFQNANGGDLDLFPAFMLIREKASTEFALIDLRELTISARAQIFIEDEPVPPDSVVVGSSWLRSNRDGSRDRRFAHNRQIPEVRYGQLHFSSKTGVAEVFQFSNCEAVLEFGRAFDALQAALRVQARTSLSPTLPVDDDVTLPDPAPLPALPTGMGAIELVSLVAIALCVALSLSIFVAPSASLPEARSQTATLMPKAGPPSRLIDQSTSRDLEPVKSEPTVAAETVRKGPPAVVPPTGPAEVLVATQNVNLRAGPDRASAALRIIAAGTKLKVFERRLPWIRVGDATAWGWVHSAYLKSEP